MSLFNSYNISIRLKYLTDGVLIIRETKGRLLYNDKGKPSGIAIKKPKTKVNFPGMDYICAALGSKKLYMDFVTEDGQTFIPVKHNEKNIIFPDSSKAQNMFFAQKIKDLIDRTNDPNRFFNIFSVTIIALLIIGVAVFSIVNWQGLTAQTQELNGLVKAAQTIPNDMVNTVNRNTEAIERLAAAMEKSDKPVIDLTKKPNSSGG